MTKLAIKLTKLIITLLILTVISLYFMLNNSLATVDGKIKVDVNETVTVTRDQMGIPTIMAQNRKDLSYALGYLHAQERLFQMDLLRRNSAGELSELFGSLALSHDKSIRAHQFRLRAEQYVNNLPVHHSELLKNYTAGINQGMADLTSRPFEYWILNKSPQQWRMADSLLVLYSMYIDLQYEDGAREQLLGHLRRNLLPDVFRFLTPKGSQWDAAIDGSTFEQPDLPKNSLKLAPLLNFLTLQEEQKFDIFNSQHEALKGSNNWVVGGKLTAHGGAIVADDMHLGIGVPNIWYRASLRYQLLDEDIAVDGVTLPGVPAIVVGSNRHIAWGFTNSYGDWNDVIKLKLNDAGTQYQTKDGFKPFNVETETILVSGKRPQHVEIKKTIWGPVIGQDHDGSLIAMRWVAHDSEGINFDLLDMERANTIEDAVAVANGAGIPAQNVVIGDANGNIAWTIAGAIPNKVNHTKQTGDVWQLPQDWSRGEFEWSGYLTPQKYPLIQNPVQDRIWTANSRVVGGEMLSKIGNGGYALGARSQQIEKRLNEKGQFSEMDLFAIQNDDSAEFLTRWHKLITEQILTPIVVEQFELEQLSQLLHDWQGRASLDSVGYLFVREFRIEVRQQLFAALQNELHTTSVKNKADLRVIRHQLEVPMWRLINEKPPHLLPSSYPDWETLLQQALLNTQTQLIARFGDLSNATWGNFNVTKIQHPLSKAVPALSWLLDMQALPASGDSYMPKVQGKAFGASQRMVVSPGREQEGIMQMPSGQASHPLSPYFGSGHKQWIEGTPTPLLPGETKYTLIMVPKTAI